MMAKSMDVVFGGSPLSFSAAKYLRITSSEAGQSISPLTRETSQNLQVLGELIQVQHCFVHHSTKMVFLKARQGIFCAFFFAWHMMS